MRMGYTAPGLDVQISQVLAEPFDWEELGGLGSAPTGLFLWGGFFLFVAFLGGGFPTK